MKINTYPEGGFGDVHYRFTARITEDDIRRMFMLPERRDDCEVLIGVMQRNGCVGAEFPAVKGTTFTETMFRGWSNAYEREVYERNRDQIKTIIRRANEYVNIFIDKFYNGAFLRDNRRIQTFTLDLAWKWPRVPGYDKEWTEEPYMPPVLNDWQPNVPPPPPVIPNEIPDATPYVPPNRKTVMDMVQEYQQPKV